MSVFTDYQNFQHVEGRIYKIGQQQALVWQIGRHAKRPASHIWQLIIWPGETADVTIPPYAEWLVWLKLIDPHDRDLIAAAFVHDKLLNEGFDKRFAAAEFRRALVARNWKTPLKRELAYWGVYFHTTRDTRQETASVS